MIFDESTNVKKASSYTFYVQVKESKEHMFYCRYFKSYANILFIIEDVGN